MSINADVFGASYSEEKLDSREVARRFLATATHDQKIAMAGMFMAQQVKEKTTSLVDGSPTTPDELWDFIYETYNIKIARVAVCPDHDPPFDYVCAAYFEWYPNIFEIGPRSGGKSFKTALILHLNSRHKPGCDSVVFGAVDDQSKKVYDDFRFVFLNKGLPPGETEVDGEAKMTETRTLSGSTVKCFPATLAKVNGPHPPKAHIEEAEIMRPVPYKESRFIATNKTMPDGRVIKAQNCGTSTRKWKNGRVDKIYQEFLRVKKKATELFGGDTRKVDDMIVKQSSFYVFINCIFEVAEQVPNCRCAPENAGLPEYDYDSGDQTRKCGCHMVINGTWDKEGKAPRTLESVCQGRFYRSRGHRSHMEVMQVFTQSDQGTWEAQQECREAETEGLYVKSFSRTRHGLSHFPLDPANGPVYTGTDWGTTHYACVLWVQYLERPVVATDFSGNPKLLPRGARVTFSEVYEPDLNAAELGEKAILREVRLARPTSFNRVPVRKRWYDLAGAGDKRTWNKMGLKLSKYSTRVVSEHIKTVRGLYDADRAFVVVPECPHYCDEIEAWREDENHREVDENFNHAMAAGRYVFYGMHDIYNDDGAQSPDVIEQLAIASAGSTVAAPAVAVSAHDGSDEDADLQMESDWRVGV